MSSLNGFSDDLEKEVDRLEDSVDDLIDVLSQSEDQKKRMQDQLISMDLPEVDIVYEYEDKLDSEDLETLENHIDARRVIAGYKPYFEPLEEERPSRKSRSSRRGWLKYMAGGAAVTALGLGAFTAANSENDAEIQQEEDTGLNRALENSGYDFWTTEDFDSDNRVIGDIIDNYRSYGGEIGKLEDQLREEYNDSVYEDLILGFHNDTSYVQLKNGADNLLVNFDFNDENQYEEARKTAKWVVE